MLARRAFTLDLRSLAAFRTAIGLLVTIDALLRSRDVSLMFAPDGMFPLGLLRDYLDDPFAWSLATLVAADWWGPAMLCLEAAAGLLLAVASVLFSAKQNQCTKDTSAPTDARSLLRRPWML